MHARTRGKSMIQVGTVSLYAAYVLSVPALYSGSSAAASLETKQYEWHLYLRKENRQHGFRIIG